jgi:putative ABC transport system permease protein
MTLPIAFRFARRELRGGFRGFAVFLACLTLGVAAIAAVGTVRGGINRALVEQGAVLLGGDAQMSFTYRFASDSERAFMAKNAATVSEIVDFRSMAVKGDGTEADRALTQVKAVDGAYPLTGQLMLTPEMSPAEAFAVADGTPGAAMDPVLADRLGLKPGDLFKLGRQSFHLSALIAREPDGATAGFTLGPRTIVRTTDLAGSGLLEPGSLFDTRYRLLLPPGADLGAFGKLAVETLRDSGMRWQDARHGAPGMERFANRMSSFLVLVGLAGLAVGGVGIASAVRSYLDGKVETIAALKALGAEGRVIFATYLIQVAMLTAVGVILGLLLGASLPMLAAPLIADQLPIPLTIGLDGRALAEAALYGTLTALLFALWPLARTRAVRAAALFRDLGAERRRWPGWPLALTLIGLAGALCLSAVGLADSRRLALGTLGGILGALLLLTLAALVLRRFARRMGRNARGRPALRLALAAIGGPREEATAVVLSLGLGLSVLAAVGQIDWNLRGAIARDLPDVAPSYFFVDIQPDQIAGFRARLASDPGVSKEEDAPMLRGVLTRINGQDAEKVAGKHWVLQGDRGLTYSAEPPPNTRITAGTFWPKDYAGPPQVSFAAEEATEMGLKLGDRITVNVLGRDVEAEITSFREVDFSTAGIGFVMVMNPAALSGAPHSFIATVYADQAAEATILRDLASAYPNITAIRVRDVIDRVGEALAAIAKATSVAAGVTLLTGLVVLIGAAASGERARIYEAAVMKTLGATRGTMLTSFALRSALMGAAAGAVAVLFGGLAGWAVMYFVMESDFRFEPISAILIVVGGASVTLLAGLAFALRPLSVRPAQVLRARD